MAKAPKEPTATKFKYDADLPIPPITRGAAAANSERTEALMNMPVGLSYLEEVHVPENITDPAERAKSFSEAARKLSNSLSGAARRIRNRNPEYVFETRIVNDEKYGHGVRVWRKEAPAVSA